MTAPSKQGTQRRELSRLAAPALALIVLLLAACKGPGAGPTTGTTAGDGAGAGAGSGTVASTAPVAVPTRIEIPSIGVDAKVMAVGLEPDGDMEVPDFGLAGWYKVGPRPGEPGPSVIVAHVDSRSGPDVFARLSELQPGGLIVVHRGDGTSQAFSAERREQVPKDDLPVDEIWSDSDVPLLRLITCGGSFDRSTGHYRDNVIVYAHLAK